MTHRWRARLCAQHHGEASSKPHERPMPCSAGSAARPHCDASGSCSALAEFPPCSGLRRLEDVATARRRSCRCQKGSRKPSDHNNVCDIKSGTRCTTRLLGVQSGKAVRSHTPRSWTNSRKEKPTARCQITARTTTVEARTCHTAGMGMRTHGRQREVLRANVQSGATQNGRPQTATSRIEAMQKMDRTNVDRGDGWGQDDDRTVAPSRRILF